MVCVQPLAYILVATAQDFASIYFTSSGNGSPARQVYSVVKYHSVHLNEARVACLQLQHHAFSQRMSMSMSMCWRLLSLFLGRWTCPETVERTVLDHFI